MFEETYHEVKVVFLNCEKVADLYTWNVNFVSIKLVMFLGLI